jgi:hypothetical protein
LASFFIRKDVILIAGRATADKILIYCRHGIHLSFPEFMIDDILTHQYQWYMIQVNIGLAAQVPAVDLTRYDQISTLDIMKTVRKRCQVLENVP